MIRYHDYTYLEFLKHIQTTGRQKTDRTGTGTTSVFDYQMKFDISHNIIPLLTSKKMYLPAIIHELIWYLAGDSNIKYLLDNNVHIWDSWADVNGDLGPVYGQMWRAWPCMKFIPDANLDIIECGTFSGPDGNFELFYQADVQINYIDQIAQVIKELKNNPDSRRMIVNAWNVGLLPDMKLPPCHYTFQFYSDEMTLEERVNWWRFESKAPDNTVTSATHEGLDFMHVPRRWLRCKLNQRSADAFLGVPFNIAQYSILTCLIAKTIGFAAKEFIWSGGDCHIYNNHQDQVTEQLSRTPFPSPSVQFDQIFVVNDLKHLKFDNFNIINYQHLSTIKGNVAV